MKKVICYSLSLVLLIVSLAGCSIKKSEIYYSYDSFDEYITVGEYSVEVDKNSDEYLKYGIEYYDQTFGEKGYSTITIGEILKWDKANINFLCTKDGKEVDGGIEMGYSLSVGYDDSGVSFLGEKLIGSPIGQTLYFDIVLDDDYQIAELAGQSVKFEVFVNYVSRKTTPTEETIKNAGFESFEDYEKSETEQIVSHMLFDRIYDATTFKASPEKETQALLDSTLAYYQIECEKNGMTLENKAASMGFTLEEYKAKIVEGIQVNYTNMPRDLVSNYILNKYDSPLTKEDIRNTKNEIIREIDTSLAEAGYSDIEIQRRAAYVKALNLLYNKFG